MASPTDVETLRARLLQVRSEIAAASQHLERLRDEEFGIALAIARLTDSPLPTRQGDSRSSGEVRYRVTPLVRSILGAASGPLTRNEICEEVAKLGSPTSADIVSASLSYLRRKGFALNTGGAWVAALLDADNPE